MPQVAFGARARLHRPGEFRAVFAHGRKTVTRGLVLIAAPGATTDARLGFALAKRRIARAVDRNRVKRVVRESFRHNRHSLGAVDIVVLARSRTAALGNADLFAQLTDAWSSIAQPDAAPPSKSSPDRAGQR